MTQEANQWVLSRGRRGERENCDKIETIINSYPICRVHRVLVWNLTWISAALRLGRAHSLRDANNKLKPKMKTTTHEKKNISAREEKQHIQIILDDDDFFSYFSRSLEFVRCTFALLLCVLLGPPRAHIYTVPACSGFEIIKQFSIFCFSSPRFALLCCYFSSSWLSHTRPPSPFVTTQLLCSADLHFADASLVYIAIFFFHFLMKETSLHSTLLCVYECLFCLNSHFFSLTMMIFFLHKKRRKISSIHTRSGGAECSVMSLKCFWNKLHILTIAARTRSAKFSDGIEIPIFDNLALNTLDGTHATKLAWLWCKILSHLSRIKTSCLCRVHEPKLKEISNLYSNHISFPSGRTPKNLHPCKSSRYFTMQIYNGILFASFKLDSLLSSSFSSFWRV